MASTNAELFARARRTRTIPDGVDSSVRAYQAVGGTPTFLRRASGPYVWDSEDTRYTDYVGSRGPAILGHAHPDVILAVQKAAADGLSSGAPTEAEIVLAETPSARLPFAADAVGGMVGLYFQRHIPTSFAEATAADLEAFSEFFQACLVHGVYFASSSFEAGFVSITQDDEIIDRTLAEAGSILRSMARNSWNTRIGQASPGDQP